MTGIPEDILIRNTGTLRGAEVLQVYVGKKDGFPEKQLQGFLKVWLNPGEERCVSIEINLCRAVESFDAKEDKWCVPTNSAHIVFLGTSASQPEIIGTVHVA